MNTVIYARYSAGPRQTDQSIEGQLRVCTDFCKQRGLTVIDTYCDRHISGRTDERPEFQRLIADAKRKKFEAVVVYKTDRFARNKYDSAVYKRELKRNGIQIFYAAEAIPDGPEGIILESLMEGLAEYYSAELAQKIKRGMHESALKCQSTGSGRPLGYRVDEQKHFQIDPESAQTVQTIFEQYIKGESNAAICELLNSRGLRTAQGKPFNKNSINRIIKNRKYIGEYRYHDIVVEGGMPAIIPKDTFNLAQAEMERRRTRKAPKSPKAEYLLAGRLFCGHCKGPMQGVSGTGKSGNKWYYYYCGNTRGKNKTCDKKQVSRDRLERAVVDFTVRYILQEEVLEELARKVHAAQERQNDTASEIAFYEKKLADNKKSIANVLRAIESGAATQTLPVRLQELENEQAVILGEISFLKGKRLAFTEDQILFALMKHLEPYPGESEQDYRRRIISDFVSEVYLYDDRLLIYFNISSEDGKLKSADLSNIEGGEFDEGLVSSTNLPHRFVRCGVFYAQKTLADRARLRTLKSDANRAGSSMYFLKIHRFHASFFAFCRVLRASTSLLCPLLGNPFKNLRTIVGRYSLELLHLIEAGVQRNRDLIVFSDANLLDELLQNGAAFIVVGSVVHIRPCKQLVANSFTCCSRIIIHHTLRFFRREWAELHLPCRIRPAHDFSPT